MAAISQKFVFHDVDTSSTDLSSTFTRFGASSYYHAINALRRHYDQAACKEVPALGKIQGAFIDFLAHLETMRANTPCIVGRFRDDALMACLSSVDRLNAEAGMAQFQHAKQADDRTVPLYGIDKACEVLDAETSDTHISIARWLETYPAEGADHPTFYDYCMWKLAKRIDLYITFLAELNCAPSDLQGLTEMRTDSLQKLMFADTTLRGLVSFRFAFSSSPWRPTHSFDQFTQEIDQKGPHILFGNFPPFCYKTAPKEMLKINGKSIMGWSKGVEHVKRPFNNAVIVIGCQKVASQGLVFYRSASDSFSMTYVSSYQKVRETAVFLFHETYAIHLIR